MPAIEPLVLLKQMKQDQHLEHSQQQCCGQESGATSNSSKPVPLHQTRSSRYTPPCMDERHLDRRHHVSICQGPQLMVPRGHSASYADEPSCTYQYCPQEGLTSMVSYVAHQSGICKLCGVSALARVHVASSMQTPSLIGPMMLQPS